MKIGLLSIMLFLHLLPAHAQGKREIPLCGLDPVAGAHTAMQFKPRIFRGKLFYDGPKAPVKQSHEWYLYLEDLSGLLMEDARIEADGVNYKAGRGFATPPSVTQYIGKGHYLIENVVFPVAGPWSMRFQVIWQNKVDVLAFEIIVEE